MKKHNKLGPAPNKRLVDYYHADRSPEEREAIQSKWMSALMVLPYDSKRVQFAALLVHVQQHSVLHLEHWRFGQATGEFDEPGN